MNKSLVRLVKLAEAENRLVIGLMSGTSLDGLDIALCRIKGSGLLTKVEVIDFLTYSYPAEFKDDIRAIFSKHQVDLEKVTLLHAKVGNLHAAYILQALRAWGRTAEEISFIASHGQTIYHAPKRLHGLNSYPDATLQIGDADHIAVKTGIITISDFRQKHIAAGGEGAPLALYGDYILFKSASEDRILLNIGGISNFTYLPAGNRSKIVCTDVGPGNTLIDEVARRYFNVPFDNGGEIASRGQVSQSLLSALLTLPFFGEPFPKTTGPELFNISFLEDAIRRTKNESLPAEDLVTTVTRFTAEAVAKGVREAVALERSPVLYVSGGGSHNKILLKDINALLPSSRVETFSSLGLSADAKEAVLFAVLANETVCGSIVETGAGPAIMMGKISLPE